MALREGGKGSLERVGGGGVEPLMWRGTESRGQDSVLVAQLRADDRSKAPPLQRQVSQMPPAPALLQMQVMAKHQGGSTLALACEHGGDVVGHHHVSQAEEPRHAKVGCIRHRGVVAKQPSSRARLHMRTPPVIARRGSKDRKSTRLNSSHVEISYAV